MNSFSYLYISIAILLLIGCTPARMSTVPRLNSPQEIQSLYIEQKNRIRTFNGSGSITIETPEFANNAAFTIAICTPDSFLIKLKGPFNISVGALLITDDKYVLVNYIEKKILRGKLDSISIQTFFHIPFSKDDLINIFTGLFAYSIIDYSSAKLKFYEDNYILENNFENKNIEMVIDGANNNFSRLKCSDAIGKSKIEAIARAYKNIDGINIPFWTRVNFPQNLQSFTIAYNEITINSPVNFYIAIPHEYH